MVGTKPAETVYSCDFNISDDDQGAVGVRFTMMVWKAISSDHPHRAPYLRMGIDRSNDIAVSKPEINMDGILGIIGACPKTVRIRVASGKFGRGFRNENCGGYVHVGLWDRIGVSHRR